MDFSRIRLMEILSKEPLWHCYGVNKKPLGMARVSTGLAQTKDQNHPPGWWVILGLMGFFFLHRGHIHCALRGFQGLIARVYTIAFWRKRGSDIDSQNLISLMFHERSSFFVTIQWFKSGDWKVLRLKTNNKNQAMVGETMFCLLRFLVWLWWPKD